MIDTTTSIVLTAGMVAQATGGQLTSGRPGQVFDGVTTDSRSDLAGRLFIALHGERFDGHDFVTQVVAQGAAGALVSTPLANASAAAVILVPDTLIALQSLARDVRRRSGAIVIAITGSAGKTTTKEVTADLLSTRYRVYRNRGNLNNHIGLPLSLIDLTMRPDLAVVELGMNHAGEIRALVAIAEPEVRVWTNVGDAHIGHFGSREAVADAKGEILEQAGPDTLVVANADDALVMSRVRGFEGRVRTFGEAGGADVRATSVIDRGFDGTTADVSTPAGTMQLQVPLPGRAHLSNVLAAITVAIEFGVLAAAIPSAVSALRPVARRGGSTQLANGVRLVDDSYNASPAAMQAALRTLAATRVDARRVAVLGEMRELGEASEALHRDCGRLAAEIGIDLLIVIGGPSAQALAAGAISAGLPASRVHRFADSASAADAASSLIGPGDLVLVKGSRGTRTDIVSDRLREVA